MKDLRQLLILLAAGEGLEEAAERSGYDSGSSARLDVLALADTIPEKMTVNPAGKGKIPNDRAVVSSQGRFTINTDGASRGNPGQASAAAIVFAPDGEVLASRAIRLGEATNNEAEYRGLILGLQLARELNLDKVLMRLDSQLVVRQMNGEYRIKQAHLENLAQKVREMSKAFTQVVYEHIPRGENREADRLANEVLDDEGDS